MEMMMAIMMIITKTSIVMIIIVIVMVIVKMIIMIRGITNVMIKNDGDDDIDNDMIMTSPSNNILTNDHDENNEL